MKSTQGMLETGMSGTGIDYGRQSQLVDAVESLEQWMFYDAIEQSTWYLDEPKDGVVDDLGFLHRSKS